MGTQKVLLKQGTFYGYENSSFFTETFSNEAFNWGFTPIGLEVDFTNWPDKASSFFEVGFDCDLGFQFPIDQNYFSFSPFYSMGPAFNFNLGKVISLRFTPGLQFNMDFATYTESTSVSDTLFDLYLALSLNLACNIWFSDGAGIKLGFDIDTPLIGVYDESYKDTNNSLYSTAIINGGFDFRFFVGFTFRWETRHYLGYNKTQEQSVKFSPETKSAFQNIPPEIPTKNNSYHAVLNGTSAGPYTKDTIVSLINAGIIHADTLLWTEGLSTWLPASEISDFADLF